MMCQFLPWVEVGKMFKYLLQGFAVQWVVVHASKVAENILSSSPRWKNYLIFI